MIIIPSKRCWFGARRVKLSLFRRVKAFAYVLFVSAKELTHTIRTRLASSDWTTGNQKDVIPLQNVNDNEQYEAIYAKP